MSEVESDRAGNDNQAKPVPPISRESDIEHLQLDAEEATKIVLKLESQQRDAMRLLAEPDGQIKAANDERDRAVVAYHRVMPKKLPPAPSLEQMMAQARRQRPDGDDRQTVMMAARLHGMLGGALAGEGRAYAQPLPDVEGTDVRNVGDHHYNIPAPPRERKSYG